MVCQNSVSGWGSFEEIGIASSKQGKTKEHSPNIGIDITINKYQPWRFVTINN
jgi:hypothetical protein